MKKKEHSTTSSDYDLSDFPITRTARQAFRNQLIPFGNFEGGPGWPNLLALLLIHRLPYPIYWLVVFFEKQSVMLYRKLAALLYIFKRADNE